MKLIPALVAVLGRSADENRCLTSDQIYGELGAKGPNIKFRVSGAMEGLVATNLIGEAENPGGERVYYPKGRENKLVEQGILSAEPHMYVTAFDRDGGVNSLRVDRGGVSNITWQGLIRGDREAMLSLVVRGEKGR